MLFQLCRRPPGGPHWLGSLVSPVHTCVGLGSAGLARVHRRICGSSSGSPQPPASLGSSEPRRMGFPQRTACPRQPSRSAHTHGDPTPASTLTRGLCPAPAEPHFFPWECAGQNPKGTHTELKTDAVRCFVLVMAARQSRKPICSLCSRPQVPGHLSCSSQVAQLCW